MQEITCKRGRCRDDSPESRFDELNENSDIVKQIDNDLVKDMMR